MTTVEVHGTQVIPRVRELLDARYTTRTTASEVPARDYEQCDRQHPHESPLLHAQEHKGHGDDEGEREQLVAPAEDSEGN